MTRELKRKDQQPRGVLQEQRNASLVPPSSGRAQADDPKGSKRASQSRRENTRARRGRLSAISGHSVFVVGVDGKALAPTTPARAKHLIRDGQAEKVWSRFGIFGLKMLMQTRHEVPETSLGVDQGTKFEGYAVVCGDENVLAVKLDLPDKKAVVRKLEERRHLRRARRHRNCRRRPPRFNNRRRRVGWLAPSQAMIVGSRLRVIRELLRIYPVGLVGLEDVRFNHAEKRCGANFSTVEIGKAKIRQEFRSRDLELFEFTGYQTKMLREKYGYRKIRDKSADRFEAHCTDALALACEAGPVKRIEPGRFVVVDDTYRPKRRRLHDTQFAPDSVRAPYSKGTVFGLRKGLKVGAANGKIGRLCGEMNGKFRYYDKNGKRQATRKLAWISTQYITRTGRLLPGLKSGVPAAP